MNDFQIKIVYQQTETKANQGILIGHGFMSSKDSSPVIADLSKAFDHQISIVFTYLKIRSDIFKAG